MVISYSENTGITPRPGVDSEWKTLEDGQSIQVVFQIFSEMIQMLNLLSSEYLSQCYGRTWDK